MTREEQRAKAAHEYIQSDSVAAGNEVLAFGDFINGAKWADFHPQWIPVEERLPEHCDCLLYTEPRNIHGPFEGRFRFGFYNYADQRWEIQGEKWDNTIVTHWMPIVPPRKED